MPLRISRNLKQYDFSGEYDPEKLADFVGDVEEIFQSIENYFTQVPTVYFRPGEKSPYPQSPKVGDFLQDYSTGTLRLAMYTGDTGWQYSA